MTHDDGGDSVSVRDQFVKLQAGSEIPDAHSVVITARVQHIVLDHQAVDPPPMALELLLIARFEIVGANYGLTTGDHNRILSHQHLFYCFFTCNELLQNLLFVQVYNSDHLVPIGREHVVPIFADAHHRNGITKFENVIADPSQNVPLAHGAIISRRVDKLVRLAGEHGIYAIRMANHGEIKLPILDVPTRYQAVFVARQN